MDRRQKYARAIWEAMVSDEPPPDGDALWREGYLDAADAVIALTDSEQEMSPSRQAERRENAADRASDAY